MGVNALRTNNLLRKQEWVELDKAVVDIARQRLVGIADLQRLGLTLSLGGLGTLISQYEAQSDMTPADITMSGIASAEKDSVDFDLRSVPVPIVSKEFDINIRRLEASRRLGDSIDVTQGTVASRRVADGLESLLFSGAGVSVDGNAIYGYTTHPDRNTGTATGPWSVIANIYPTVLDMIRDMHADRMWGSYMLYVAGDVWPDLLQVYDDGSGETARDRVLRIPQLTEIKPADELSSGEAVMVQMSRDTVDLAVAQDIATVEWATRGGMITNFLVFACMVPRLKSDHSGRMGIVHYSGLRPVAGPS